MRAALLVAIALVGCGRLGYLETPNAPVDGALRDGGMVDAGSSDGGTSDAGSVDSGEGDAGRADAGSSDAGPSDAGPSDAGPSDAGAIDGGTDGGLDLPCGTIALLSDDFEDGVVAPDWLLFDDLGLTTVEQTGRVHVRFAATVGPGSYAGYQTTMLRDLSAACVTIEVDAVPDPATEALTYIKIIVGAREVEIIAVVGFVLARIQEGGVVTNVASIPHDPVAHRHWRIRNAGGSIRCELSADGVAFMHLATITESTSLTNALIGFGAGAHVPTTGVGDAQFESITVTSR